VRVVEATKDIFKISLIEEGTWSRVDQGVFFRQFNAQFLQKKMGNFKPIKKKEGKCGKKCQT